MSTKSNDLIKSDLVAIMSDDYKRSIIPKFGPLLAILAIIETALTRSVSVGNIITFVTAVIILFATTKPTVIFGGIGGILAVIFMIDLAKYNLHVFSTLNNLKACAQHSSNASIADLQPSSSSYPLLSNYGVNFYGETNYYSNAGNCEIENYYADKECYCVENLSGDCKQVSLDTSCATILKTSFQNKFQSGFIVDIITVIFLGFLLVGCVFYLVKKPDDGNGPGWLTYSDLYPVTERTAVPTTAQVHVQTIVLDHPLEPDNMIESNNRDGLGSILSTFRGTRNRQPQEVAVTSITMNY